MKLSVAGALCAVLLSGCATLAMHADPKVNFAQDQSACEAYGFRHNTDAFAQCMELRDQQRQASDDAARGRISAGLRSLGQQLAAPPRSTLTTCTTTGSAYGSYGSVSGHSTTTCF